ncbi:MAG TPA: DUF3524 domain-containing protein [Tepidisphaeraceae bacterium]|jgi:hypothetical protein|nr:DUF3524 domain-containing protein [Tepidisphaeraceae bacterium]
MSTQLDILALEPFFGGARRHMLETVIRCSRHRWTLLKLPPRRMERRLSVAANWFAEQLSRHWSSRSDILFTSEAMNLASLYRLAPAMARQPSVVYFHENQLLAPQARRGRAGRSVSAEEIAFAAHAGAMSALAARDSERGSTTMQSRDVDVELVNLNTATAATEIWFNSTFHMRSFLASATALVDSHPELSSHNPMADVTAKAHLMPPPIDLNLVPHVRSTMTVPPRDPRAIFVDTRDGQLRMLNAALAELASRGQRFRLITVGPIEDLSDHWARRTVSETDDFAHVLGLLEAGVVLSVRPGAACDLQVIRGLQAGCRPVLPDRGIYPDLIPVPIRDQCLYPFNVDSLADALEEAINPAAPWNPPDLRPSLKPFEAIAATRIFDERLSSLALAHAAE